MRYTVAVLHVFQFFPDTLPLLDVASGRVATAVIADRGAKKV